MNRINGFCVAGVAALFFLSSGLCFAQSGLSVPLDGFNVSVPSSMESFDGGLSFTKGDPGDSFYAVVPAGDSIGYHCRAATFLGSESGDPLLNNFVGSGRANRDHETLNSLSLIHPRIPLSAVVRYRYVDTYSDRFDWIWNEYWSRTGRIMAECNRGLATEVFVAADYLFKDVRLTTTVDKFEFWHATPYYFSPLYESGTDISPSLDFKAGSVFVSAKGGYRLSSWYYDHINPVDFYDYRFAADMRAFAGERVSGNLSVGYDNTFTPAAQMRCGVQYGDSTIGVGVNGTFFSDMETSFDARFVANIGNYQQWRCTVSVSHDYLPQERDFWFMEFDTTVVYRFTALRRNRMSSVFDWRASNRFPAGLSAKVSYCDHPAREFVSKENDTTVITQAIDRKSARVLAGVGGYLNVSDRHWGVSFVPSITVPVGKCEQLHFFNGKSLMLTISATTAGSHPASASLSLRCRDRSTLDYILEEAQTDRRIESFSASATEALYFSFSLPVVVPFFPSKINTGIFEVNVGPVHLTGPSRRKFHPKGNPMGPEINAGITWNVP